MTAPDTSTITIFFLNALSWVVIWIRGERRDAVRNYQHDLMYRAFLKERKLNGNGKLEVT